MHILVTNDDGVLSPGFLALAQAMRDLGQVSTCSVAPDRNWSGGGHVKTIDRAMRRRKFPNLKTFVSNVETGAITLCDFECAVGQSDSSGRKAARGAP
jgi:5'/3'-nucleotidase SurE